jgi:GntR family histidine utilization transcriptional repressor
MSSYLSVYAAVAAELRRRVAEGVYPPGFQLPHEDALAREFRCSRGVINRAMRDLRAEGVVEVRRGIGTFAGAGPVQVRPVELVAFVRQRLAEGDVLLLRGVRGDSRQIVLG